jgi:hypothetical protein
MYTFDDRKTIGSLGESLVTQYLLQMGNQVDRATLEQDKQGVDLICLNPTLGRTYSVQVKTDAKAYRSGSAVIETVSNSVTGASGWVYTCTADFLFYVIPETRLCEGGELEILERGMAIVLRPQTLRDYLPSWLDRYPAVESSSRSESGRTYKTQGIFVPTKKLIEIATKLVTLSAIASLQRSCKPHSAS